MNTAQYLLTRIVKRVRKKRTDVVNDLATDPNPTNEDGTMNERADKTLEETEEALANT